jgi:hypothetical protein
VKWFARIFGAGHQPAAGQPAPLGLPNAAQLVVYNQLIDQLVAEPALRATIYAAVARAFANPQSFYDEHQKYTLAIRGLTFAKHAALTPKFVFIDTLCAHNLMAEVDWKEEEGEIRQQVRAIMQARQYHVVISAEEQYEDEPTYEVIYLLDHEELGPDGYSLQTLDIQSDSYVFTIVRRQEATRVQELFRQL